MGVTTQEAACRALPLLSRSRGKQKDTRQPFSLMKTVGLMRKTRHRGRNRVNWVFTFTAAAYNLIRMRNLAPEV